MRRIAFAVIWAVGVVSLASADDPPKAARPRAATKKVPAAAKDEPPPCAHMVPPKARPAARKAQPRSMPEMFDRMMGDMSRDPANGFAGTMREQQTAAIRATTITAAEERRLGRAQRDAYLRAARAKGFTVREVARDTDYLKALVAKFSKRMKNGARYPDLEVTLVDAPMADGQSFPGGFLVFTTALLDEPDEATVAGVVAHELAHLDRGHLNEYARRDKFANNAFQFGPEMMANPEIGRAHV